MKRLYLSIILLALLTAGGILSTVYIVHENDLLQSLCADIRAEALRGEDTSDEVEALCDEWERHCKIMAFIENASNLANVTAEVARLPALSQTNSPDLIQQTDAVSAQCAMLAERQFPHLRSVM